MYEYNILTLNVNGLHNPIKRSKAIAKIKRERQDIIFWQETHLSDTEHEKLQKMGFKKVYYSSYERGNARGVAILISNKVNFQFSSKIRDKEGRYLLVKGFIDHKEVTFLNVYRPPGYDKQLINIIFNLISREASGVLVCGGDWNICLNPSVDSSNKAKKMQPEALYVKKLFKEIGLSDVWRELHPHDKRFTFFSHPHQVYSRIDYFFMFNLDKHRISKCDIGVRDISDHAGVYLSLHFDNEQKEHVWRLNTGLLNDPECQNYITKEFKEYMTFNDNGAVSPSTLWDASKAFLRGKLIMWSSQKKREREKQVKDLIRILQSLEMKHINSKDTDILNQIEETKQALNNIYEKQMEKKAKYVKQSFYENGPKSKKILAWRIRKQQAERFIPKIKDPDNKKISHVSLDIRKSFEKYYTKLYTQPEAADLNEVSKFLTALDLPTVGTDQNKILTKEISEEEINKAISRLKAHKMSGADGYPSEWFKTFREILVPLLKRCFNYILKGGETPLSWGQAIISVIPKPGKDKTECSAYRPISVLNIDYRLYASILARRLETIIPDLIDTDQAGFVKGRQTQDNVRRALHLIDVMSHSNMQSVVISLDAEKAFDAVRWEYLYLVLARFGFNDQVIGCIKSLYCDPTARIKINGNFSDIVPLNRGCRQGCPLSPTLFALFIEPLIQAIREDKDITGVLVAGEQYKICAYADDILLTLSDPDTCLPKLLSLLKIFGSLSGYKLNLNKTQTLTFNYTPQQNIHRMSQFKWKGTVVKYLGIQLPKDLSRIYDHNYTSVTVEIKNDLNRWSLLPMNMYDRIDTIKMKVLPKLLFLFQSLPLQVTQKQFSEWNRMISNFIWEKRRPRVKFQTLQLPKDKGGLALPCLEDYYRAAQLRSLVFWCDPNCEAKWKRLEQNQINIPLQSLLGDKSLLNKHLENLNSCNTVSLRIWHKLLKDKKFEKNARILRWVAYDTDFTPARLDYRFKKWIEKGITSYCMMVSSKGLKTFQQLKVRFNLEKQDFFRYLQLRNYFNKNIRSLEEEETNLVKIFIEALKGNTTKKLISKIYSSLQLERGLSTLYVKLRWEKDANIKLTEEDWLNICKVQSTTSSSNLWREFTWKNIMRFFITPRIKESQSNNPQHAQCWRKCGCASAGHFHIFWECPKITAYWTDVMKAIRSILCSELIFNFSVIFLGNIPAGLKKQDRYLLQILLASSKKAITKRWLNEEPPTLTEWKEIVQEIQCMEKLTFSLRQAAGRGELYWKNWKKYISL